MSGSGWKTMPGIELPLSITLDGREVEHMIVGADGKPLQPKHTPEGQAVQEQLTNVMRIESEQLERFACALLVEKGIDSIALYSLHVLEPMDAVAGKKRWWFEPASSMPKEGGHSVTALDPVRFRDMLDNQLEHVGEYAKEFREQTGSWNATEYELVRECERDTETMRTAYVWGFVRREVPETRSPATPSR